MCSFYFQTEQKIASGLSQKFLHKSVKWNNLYQFLHRLGKKFINFVKKTRIKILTWTRFHFVFNVFQPIQRHFEKAPFWSLKKNVTHSNVMTNPLPPAPLSITNDTSLILKKGTAGKSTCQRLKTRFRYKKCGPEAFTRSVVIQPSSSQHLILCGVNISDFTLHDFLLVAHSAKLKMKYLSSKF